MKIATYDRKNVNGLATYLSFRWKGGRHRPLLGYNLSNMEKATLAIAMVQRIQNPPTIIAAPATTGPGETLATFAKRIYYRTLRTKKRLDLKRPKGIVDNHLAPHFTMPMVEISAETCLMYVEKRQKNGANDWTIRREFGVLNRILTLAIAHRVITANVSKAVQLSEGSNRDRVATRQELEALQEAADEDMWKVIVAAVMTGLRQSKVLMIQPAWIVRRADGEWLVLPPALSRLKGTPKEMPLNTLAAWALTPNAPCLRGRLFGRWKPRSFKKAWAVLCTRAGVSDFHFHDLRHVFSTVLQNHGVSYEVRQWLLGHRMPGKTGDYSHGGQQWNITLRQAVTALDGFLPAWQQQKKKKTRTNTRPSLKKQHDNETKTSLAGSHQPSRIKSGRLPAPKTSR